MNSQVKPNQKVQNDQYTNQSNPKSQDNQKNEKKRKESTPALQKSRQDERGGNASAQDGSLAANNPPSDEEDTSLARANNLN